MHVRKARRLGWGLWMLTLMAAMAALPLIRTVESLPGFLFLTTLLATVGALIVSRQPSNAIGWIFCAAAASLALNFLTGAYAVYAYRVGGGRLPAAQLVEWASGWLWIPPIWLLSAPLLLLFPNGRLLGPRWRWVLWIAAGFIPFAFVGNAFSQANSTDEFPNPYAIVGAESILSLAQTIAGMIMLFSLAAGIVSLVLRYRRGGWVERQQLKWFLAAAAVLPVAVMASEAYPALQTMFMPIALALLPAATGIAILRYRLYDIDIIINRTLVYGLLTILLAFVYVGCVVVLQTLVVPVVGGSEIAIVASTLVIAALFTPLRRRIQNLIDRRFYRRKYDAAKVLAAFGTTARDETDLDALTGEMLRVVDETVQPEFVGLWLKETPKR
jgi:hypothetical protein